MERENGTPQITLNGNHVGRKHESPGVPQPIQEVSYLSQGRTRERMAIGVIPLTINGPAHLIYCVPAKTAPRLRIRSQRLWKIAGEALGMKPEPTEIRGKMTRPRQAQEVMTGREDHRRSQRKLEQVGEPRALGPVWSHKGELRPRGGPERRENTRNDSHLRERVSLKTVPGLEKRVRGC